MFNFGKHLKELRQSKGLTQKQLAILINSNERVVQHYELGDRKPGFDAIIALAKALEVSSDKLLGLEE